MADLTVYINGAPVPIFLGENATLASSAAARAEAAAASAEAEADRAEVAADLATSPPDFYNTYAEATADLASIAADAYVTVLADETRGGGRSVYQKSGGVLVFRATLSPGMVLLDQFVLPGDADDTDALERAIAALYAAGGGMLMFGPRQYNVSSSFKLPNTETARPTFQSQPAMKWVGCGAGGNGRGDRDLAATTLHWTADTGSEEAKILTLGLGTFIVEDIQFSTVAAATKPFIKTTFTTVFRNRCGFVSELEGRAATHTAIIYGGTTLHEQAPNLSYDTRLSDAGFQGYGSCGSNNYYSGMKHAAVLQAYSNSIMEINPNVWTTCGAAAGADSAPFMVNGQSNSNPSSGFRLLGGVVELRHYDWGAIIDNAANVVIDTDMWDAEPGAQGGVWLKENTTECVVHEHVTGGLYAVAGRSTLDEGTGAPNTIHRVTNGERSEIVALKTNSTSANRNEFQATDFTDGTNTRFMPRTDGLEYAFNSMCFGGTSPAFRVETQGTEVRVRFYNNGVETASIQSGGFYLGASDVIRIGGNQVVGPRQSIFAAPSGGATVDAESRTAIAEIRAILLNHGLAG